jgi:hypothetical protein
MYLLLECLPEDSGKQEEVAESDEAVFIKIQASVEVALPGWLPNPPAKTR